jgi:DNA-binding IclR family transcriptional regulator
MAHDAVKPGAPPLSSQASGSKGRYETGRGGSSLASRMARHADTSAGRGVQVIARAASILRLLEERPEGLTLAEIARDVGLARSTVQRILAALAAEDFVVEAQPGRGARIGPGLARLASSLVANITAVLHARLVALRDQFGETVDLSILSGGSAVFIDQIPGRHRLVAVSAVGERFPLHCTANGKAMLACFPPQQAAALIEKSVASHRSHPLADRDKLLREIAAVRRTHVGFDRGEHEASIGAVGVAVFDSFGRPVAVSIPVPWSRFAKRTDVLAKALRRFRNEMQGIFGGKSNHRDGNH